MATITKTFNKREYLESLLDNNKIDFSKLKNLYYRGLKDGRISKIEKINDDKYMVHFRYHHIMDVDFDQDVVIDKRELLNYLENNYLKRTLKQSKIDFYELMLEDLCQDLYYYTDTFGNICKNNDDTYIEYLYSEIVKYMYLLDFPLYLTRRENIEEQGYVYKCTIRQISKYEYEINFRLV